MLDNYVVVSVMLTSFLAMIKILLISLAGVAGATYPRANPLLPLKLLQQLAKLSNLIFLPCLIITSLGAIDSSNLNRLGILIVFSFVINIASFFCINTLGLLVFNAKDPFFIAVCVAVGSPNAISMPIMVMQSLCEQAIINDHFESDAHYCYKEASSMLFVYSIGWHIMFWTYCFNRLKSIIALQAAGVDETADQGTGDLRMQLSSLLARAMAIRKDDVTHLLAAIVLSPSMIAIVVGILISVIPNLQGLLFDVVTSPLHPLGSALITLGDPVVAINCLIMSASLAHVSFKKAEESGGAAVIAADPLIEGNINKARMRKKMTARSKSKSRSELKLVSAVASESSIEVAKSVVVTKPSLLQILSFITCRLIIPPLIMLPLVLVAVRVGMIGSEDRLMQLIIVVEAASTSAQMNIVVLNQIGLPDIATKMAYLFVFQYCSSIFSMTIWATIAISLFYT